MNANYRYRDNKGSTKASLNAFNKHLHKIGKVKSIKGYVYQGRYHTNHVGVMVKGQNGTIRLAGLSWGYNGEGCRGLKRLLVELNYNQQQIDFVLAQPWEIDQPGVKWELTPEQNFLPLTVV